MTYPELDETIPGRGDYLGLHVLVSYPLQSVFVICLPTRVGATRVQ